MNIRAVLLDIGGVLLDGTRPLPGAVQALSALRASGTPFLLLTNTTRTAHADLLAILHRAGLDVAQDQLLTPASMARAWLQGHGCHAHLLVHPSLLSDFSQIADGESLPEAVVVGDAGEAFDYAALNRAFRLLMSGAPLLSLSGARYFREAGELMLDAGPFVRLLEFAAGVQAQVLGKPGALFFQHAVQQLGLPATQILMIGDDVHSDVRGAHDAGLQAALVQSGKYHAGDENELPLGAMLCRDVLAAVEAVLLKS
ncbi:MAG: TIGR01458 family HAD-type hydrolase [Pseudomonadota bacterium]